MTSVETTLQIDVPVHTAYAQWTQLESFPKFMDGIESVDQMSDTVVRFTGRVAGKKHAWTAKIVEQVPDERIAWISVAGAETGGTVLFEAIDDRRCEVTLLLQYRPQDLAEDLGAPFFKARVKRDLRNFKRFIEARQVAEGDWEGEVHGGVRQA